MQLHVICHVGEKLLVGVIKLCVILDDINQSITYVGELLKNMNAKIGS
jgi:hypothetical protein